MRDPVKRANNEASKAKHWHMADPLETLYDDAVFAYTTGDYTAAVEGFTEVLATAPTHFEARKALRTSDYKGRRFRIVLGLLTLHLSPESVFLLERDSEGTRLQAFCATEGENVDTDHLLARIRDTLGKNQSVGYGPNGELAFKLPVRGGCRRLVYIEFGTSVHEWETEYVDELLYVLGEEA